MFGGMIGIWIADLWSRAGSPAFRYIELGPGRGPLAADALRVMARFGCMPQGVHLVETTPALRAAQLARLPAAEHYAEMTALPNRQRHREGRRWAIRVDLGGRRNM